MERKRKEGRGRERKRGRNADGLELSPPSQTFFRQRRDMANSAESAHSVCISGSRLERDTEISSLSQIINSLGVTVLACDLYT